VWSGESPSTAGSNKRLLVFFRYRGGFELNNVPLIGCLQMQDVHCLKDTVPTEPFQLIRPETSREADSWQAYCN
jgi:hypothetical protein